MKAETFVAVARGVGRKDYTGGVEKTVEPVITGYQSVFMHRQEVVVPAGGNVVVNIPVPLDQVVLLYDFFASIPGNRLVRLKVDAVAPDGTTATILHETSYQTVAVHLLKGYPFFNVIRFTVYNYGPVDEDYMRIGCSGLYTTLEEYYLEVSPTPPTGP